MLKLIVRYFDFIVHLLNKRMWVGIFINVPKIETGQQNSTWLDRKARRALATLPIMTTTTMMMMMIIIIIIIIITRKALGERKPPQTLCHFYARQQELL